MWGQLQPATGGLPTSVRMILIEIAEHPDSSVLLSASFCLRRRREIKPKPAHPQILPVLSGEPAAPDTPSHSSNSLTNSRASPDDRLKRPLPLVARPQSAVFRGRSRRRRRTCEPAVRP
jgi:hypothetical protein